MKTPTLTQGEDGETRQTVTGELCNLCVLVLERAADAGAEVGDRRHVGRQAVHFVFHLFEVVLHLSYGVWWKTA